MQIPVGGTIRTGIMVPTKAAAANPKLVAAYNDGIEAGYSFKELNDQLKKDFNLDRNPLTPKNAPYYTVRPGDFAMPEVAARILDLYGEDRGEGVHLYRFPVIFPVDQRLAVVPHQFVTYTANERKYWSEYSADGTRYCMTKAPAEINERSRRAPKVWGGRASILRPDNDGVCDPNKCAEYRAGQCALSGRFIFYIPGIPGVKAIQLKTRSIYSLKMALEQLQLVGLIRGGKISGLYDGEPLFWISKKQQEVSMLDEAGKSKRVKQWLISLDSTIDMAALMDRSPRLEKAQESVQALTGPAIEPATEEAARASNPPDDTPRLPSLEDAVDPQSVDPEALGENARKAKRKTAREEFINALHSCDISRDDFRAYADKHLSQDWWNNTATLENLAAELIPDSELHNAILNEVIPF